MRADDGKYDHICAVWHVPGACMLIKREVIEVIGLLDEKFIQAFFEDVDYSLRARKAGFKIIYCGKVKLIHLAGQTTSRISKYVIYYLGPRNRYHLLVKHKKLLFLLPLHLLFDLIRDFLEFKGKKPVAKGDAFRYIKLHMKAIRYA